MVTCGKSLNGRIEGGTGRKERSICSESDRNYTYCSLLYICVFNFLTKEIARVTRKGNLNNFLNSVDKTIKQKLLKQKSSIKHEMKMKLQLPIQMLC